MPDFTYERDVAAKLNAQSVSSLSRSRQLIIVGVDEAGCGPWAGPVVAGAVWFQSHEALPDQLQGLINDSKQLSEQKRTKAFEILVGSKSTTLPIDHHKTIISGFETAGCQSKDALDNIPGWRWGIGLTTAAEIDSMNIRQATMLAMKRAVEGLSSVLKHASSFNSAFPTNFTPDFALVDGIAKPDLSCPLMTIKKGDTLSYSIGSASIVAKVYRDLLMRDLDQHYPDYGWASNAGYGTKRHQEALEKYGVTPHHRRSFKPIAARLAKGEEAKNKNIIISSQTILSKKVA